MMNPVDNPRNIGNAYGGESNMLDALASLADQAPASVQPGIPASAAPPVEEYVGAQQGMPGAQQRQIRAEVQQAAANPVERPTAPPPEVVIPYPDPLKYDMTNPRDIDRYNKDYVAVAIQRGDLTVPTPQATGAVNTQEVVNAGAQPGQAVQPVQNGGPSVSNAQPQGGASPVVRPLVGIRGSGRRDQGDMGTSTGSPVNPGGQPSGGGVPAARPAPAVGGGTPAAPQRPAAAGGAPTSPVGGPKAAQGMEILTKILAEAQRQAAGGQGASSSTPATAPAAGQAPAGQPVSPARKQRQADAQLNRDLRASGQLPADGSQMAQSPDPRSPAQRSRQEYADTTRRRIQAGDLPAGEVSHYSDAEQQAFDQTANLRVMDAAQQGLNVGGGMASRAVTPPRQKAPQQQVTGFTPVEGAPRPFMGQPRQQRPAATGNKPSAPGYTPPERQQFGPFDVKAIPGEGQPGVEIIRPGKSSAVPQGYRPAPEGAVAGPAKQKAIGPATAAGKSRVAAQAGKEEAKTEKRNRAIVPAGTNTPALRKRRIEEENASRNPNSAASVKAKLDKEKADRALAKNSPSNTMNKITEQEFKNSRPKPKPVDLSPGKPKPVDLKPKQPVVNVDLTKKKPTKQGNTFNAVRNTPRADKPTEGEWKVTQQRKVAPPKPGTVASREAKFDTIQKKEVAKRGSGKKRRR